MRTLRALSLILLGLSGCATTERSPSPRASQSSSPQTSSLRPTPALTRARFTAQNNPTTLAGRGEPSLEEADRPAAWVSIDGKAGKFREREGRRMIEWVVEQPVSASPTFRVEGYEPLLGDARDFKCVLRTLDSTEGTEFMYGIAAKAGTFAQGTDYSLLNPGDNFMIRNGLTGDLVREIAPLAPGTYALAAGLRNAKTKKEAAAVTYFTVVEAP